MHVRLRILLCDSGRTIAAAIATAILAVSAALAQDPPACGLLFRHPAQ